MTLFMWEIFQQNAGISAYKGLRFIDGEAGLEWKGKTMREGNVRRFFNAPVIRVDMYEYFGIL